MSTLVYMQLEVNHANTNGVAWYVYTTGPIDLDEVKKAYDNENDRLVGAAPLGIAWTDNPTQVPTPLTDCTGLRRYWVGDAC